MSTNFLRVYNNGQVYMPQNIEEQEIENKNNLLHYFNFADGCIFDRRYYFQIDYHKFAVRDAFPPYTSLNNIKFKSEAQYNMLRTNGFSKFRDVVYEVTGKVKVTYIKESDLDLPVRAGVMTGDTTYAENWCGVTVGNSKSLTGGWHEFYGITPASTNLNTVNYITPWFTISGNTDEIQQTMYIEFKDVNIIPKNISMPDIETKTKVRYVTMDVQGWVDTYTNTSFKPFCNILEIKAIDCNGDNVALNKPVTTIPDKSLLSSGAGILSRINDNDISPGNYVCFDLGINPAITDNYYSFTIDLGSVYDIDRIEVYNFHERIYSFSIKVGETNDNMICIYNNEFNNGILRPLLINRERSTNPLPIIIKLKDMLFNNSVDGLFPAFPEKTYTYNLSDFKSARFVGNARFLPYRNDMNFAMLLPVVTDYILEFTPPPTVNTEYVGRLVLDSIDANTVDLNMYNIEFSAWVFVEPEYDSLYAPIIKLEESPDYYAEYSTYDITRKGTWQFLKTVYKSKVNPNNIAINTITPLIQGVYKQAWKKGKVYVTGISLNKIKKSNSVTETGLITPKYTMITPNVMKSTDFSMFLEFDILNDITTYTTIFNDFGESMNFKITIFVDKSIEIRNNGNMFVTKAKVRIGKNKLALSLTNNVMKISINGSDVESGSYSWNISTNYRCRFFNKSINQLITDDLEPFNNKLCKFIVYDDVKTDSELINMTKQPLTFKLREDKFNYIIEETALTKKIKQLLIQGSTIKYFPMSRDGDDVLSTSKLVSNYDEYNIVNDMTYIGQVNPSLFKGDITDDNILEITSPNNLTNVSFTFDFINENYDNVNLDVWFGSRENKSGLVQIPLKITGCSYESIYKSIKATGNKIFLKISDNRVFIENLNICGGGTNEMPGNITSNYTGLKLDYLDTMRNDISESFTIYYKIKIIKAQMDGYVATDGRVPLFHIGAYGVTNQYLFIGKSGLNKTYNLALRGNLQQDKDYTGLTYDDWYNNEIAVTISFNALNNNLTLSVLFENGKKIEDTIILNNKLVSSTCKDNGFEFTIGTASSSEPSINCLIRDIVIVNKYLSPSEVKDIVAPFSLGVTGIRSGYKIHEGKKI